MAIQIGQQLGSLEITALLGKGGMGEVYRARDTKLKREVAIKILPDEFSRDAERVARLRREAEVLASLNHPNVAAIYDLGEANNATFLILELVEGETLADRIARGPISLDEILNIAKAISEALEAAHEKGVIHRDLKPANIKMTPDGKVKVLDFGLAKAVEPTSTSALSNSPTLISIASHAGLILGTAAYMSPEQAKGKSVDKRADIWAFGVVLYEMLTGRMLFSGETVSETMAFVMTKEPDWNVLPNNTPSRLRELLRRCLVKDPSRRLRDIGDARLEIEQIMAQGQATREIVTDGNAGAIHPQMTERPRTLAWIGSGVIGLMLGCLVILWIWAPWHVPPPASRLRLSTELGADVSLSTDIVGNSTLAMSPDGTLLAFVGTKGGVSQIYLRRLGELQASPLGGTVGAVSPFFSPDGQWIAFFADLKLKKISVTGGAAVTLCDALVPRGGAWGEDDNIVFSPNATSATNVLLVVSSAGGKAEPVTKLGQGEVTHRWPQVLPGAKAIIYTAHTSLSDFDSANVVVQPLPTGTARVIVRGAYHAQYISNGRLLYVHDGTLFTVPFDLDRLDVRGQPVPAVEGVNVSGLTGSAQFAHSRMGTLAYLAGRALGGSEEPIFWMSRNGKIAPLRSTPSDWSNPSFSPDGGKLAVDIADRQNDVWVYEWARDTLTRVTFDPGDDRQPVWTPDGKRIAFSSNRLTKSVNNLFWQRADGTGEVQQLTESQNQQVPASWHPSGKYLAYYEGFPGYSSDIMILPIEGDEASGWKPGKPVVFLKTPAGEEQPMFSPDGKWIAYQSNESGRNEVFVRPFPGPGGKWQISTGGGDNPTWSRSRHELLYREVLTGGGQIMVTSYTVEGDSFKADKPRPWSPQPILPRTRQRNFDLHPDGDRLAVSAATETATEEKRDKIVLIFNLFNDLRLIAPVKK